jgi:hypothetical protein
MRLLMIVTAIALAAVLYDLDRDPGETTNVAATHPEVVQRIAALMRRARTPSVLPRWNFQPVTPGER